MESARDTACAIVREMLGDREPREAMNDPDPDQSIILNGAWWDELTERIAAAIERARGEPK